MGLIIYAPLIKFHNAIYSFDFYTNGAKMIMQLNNYWLETLSAWVGENFPGLIHMHVIRNII